MASQALFGHTAVKNLIKRIRSEDSMKPLPDSPEVKVII